MKTGAGQPIFPAPVISPTSGIEIVAGMLVGLSLQIASGRDTRMAPDRSLRGFVVLIVEDDAQTLMGLLQLVGEALGCGLLSATCAEEALRIIDSGVNVDLVFSDVVMPQMDGVTLADLIRRRLPGLPVVLATGRPDVVDWVPSEAGLPC